MKVIHSITSLAKKYMFISRLEMLKITEHMTRIILTGSFGVSILITLLLSFSYFILGHTYVSGRILIVIAILLYLIFVSYFVYIGRVRLGAWLLVILYSMVGILILHTWGVNAPIGILILGFVIFLTSVILGPKYTILVTIGIIGLLSALQYFNIIGFSQPDRTILDNESSYGDVAGYSVIFIIFAVIAWLSGVKTEATLGQAIKAEQALQEEKNALAMRVEEQTKRILDAQQKELKQLYKFAELGQLTTIILHELANYLSVLTLDIEDLKQRDENSIAMKHAKESIFYIDNMIDQVRNQIRDSDDTKSFDALATTKEAIEQLRKKLSESNIKLFTEGGDAKNYTVFGDPLRLYQAITILVTNAAQASHNKQSAIIVDISSTRSVVDISVKDFGTGITEESRRHLFQPQKSKKGSGLGIGLYVTKQIIDTHFKGKIWLSPSTKYTEFNIQIPKLSKNTKKSKRGHTQSAPTSPSPRK